jgi:hypothetical protein
LYSSGAAPPPAAEGKRKLMGASKFVRKNPKSDHFKVLG